jgi:hypothetical protein
MDETEWAGIEDWHVLFDALCNRAGYYDDATLAAAYCALTKSKGQRQFETALRNLNNWRSGRHLPREGNLRILARLLGADADPKLRQHWDLLYRQAKDIDRAALSLPALQPETALPAGAAREVASRPHPANGSRKRFSAFQTAATGLAMLIVGATLGSLVTASGWRPWPGPADNAPIIPFTPLITMKVGDSRPIHAERGDCGKLPRDWPQVQASLPALRTGTFSDGGLARRHSKFCRGLTPARAIVFTAQKPGVEEFEIQGDFFKLTVIE